MWYNEVKMERQMGSREGRGTDMKKKVPLVLAVVLILVTGIAVWYHAQIDLMNLDPDEVMEIAVFNGSSGNTTQIKDREQIQHIIDDLNGIELKRSKLSVGYTGYSFQVTIYLSDGSEAEGWNHFIINSEDTIRKDPFFYSVTEGKIEYGYIENLVD